MAPDDKLNRDGVLGNLRRPAILSQLLEVERQIGATIVFRALPSDHESRVDVCCDPQTYETRLRLRFDWQDQDIAHETEHLRLQLVERYGILAWRRGPRPPSAEVGIGRINSYVQDQVVHERLRRLGLGVDGDIIDQAFAMQANEAAGLLEKGYGRENDGMVRPEHLDRGKLVRVCYYVQASLLFSKYRRELSVAGLEMLDRFCFWFKRCRPEETEYGERVLSLFSDNDVQTVTGHDGILVGWAGLEGLQRWARLAHYEQMEPGKYTLRYSS